MKTITLARAAPATARSRECWSGAVAVGAGQLVAGITGAAGSPVVAVGQLQIDFTPPAQKNFAIRPPRGACKW